MAAVLYKGQHHSIMEQIKRSDMTAHALDGIAGHTFNAGIH